MANTESEVDGQSEHNSLVNDSPERPQSTSEVRSEPDADSLADSRPLKRKTPASQRPKEEPKTTEEIVTNLEQTKSYLTIKSSERTEESLGGRRKDTLHYVSNSTLHENVQIGTMKFSIPVAALRDTELINNVFTMEMWDNLSRHDRDFLRTLLPQHPMLDDDKILQPLFNGSNIHFGNPIEQIFENIRCGKALPDVAQKRDQLRHLEYLDYTYRLYKHHNEMNQKVLTYVQKNVPHEEQSNLPYDLTVRDRRTSRATLMPKHPFEVPPSWKYELYYPGIEVRPGTDIRKPTKKVKSTAAEGEAATTSGVKEEKSSVPVDESVEKDEEDVATAEPTLPDRSDSEEEDTAMKDEDKAEEKDLEEQGN